MEQDKSRELTEITLRHYPDVQAVYLFGSFGTPDERADSDLDIAVLLPPAEAKRAGGLVLGKCWEDLHRAANREVDLINLRRVGTVFQIQIIMANRRIYCADAFAADEFEMLTLSYYQKLNQERREVLAAGVERGRFYDL